MTDAGKIDTSPESVAAIIAKCRKPGWKESYIANAADLLEALSAIPEAVEQERELIKRAYLGVSVLRTMLQKEGMRLGVQAADDLMADMASLMPELPGTLALRARTTEQKGDRHE